ncbi:MAG: SDR family oxidoreductase [bacterium]|nr:SDR family oxidoreductase [Gemmatimonadota bacterium]
MSGKGRVMIITGTRKGIGLDLSHHYLDRGWTVVGCSRGESDLKHERYRHWCVDVADEPEVVKMVRDTAKEFGRLDAVVNNAGIASMNHAVLTPLSTVRKVFETNVFGTFMFCREAAKVMMRAKKGRLVNCATVATPLKLEGEAAYAASKAAIESLTEVLAREFAPFHVTVNAVGPTPIATDLIRSVPPEKIEALIGSQAVKRLGESRDVANVVDFFLRDESDFVTGQTVYLGGIS